MGSHPKAKTTRKKIKDEKLKYYIRNNSAGAWLLLAVTGGERS